MSCGHFEPISSPEECVGSRVDDDDDTPIGDDIVDRLLFDIGQFTGGGDHQSQVGAPAAAIAATASALADASAAITATHAIDVGEHIDDSCCNLVPVSCSASAHGGDLVPFGNEQSVQFDVDIQQELTSESTGRSWANE